MCEHPYYMRFSKAYPLEWKNLPEEWQKLHKKGRFVSKAEYNQLKDLQLLDEDNIIPIPCGYCAECKLAKAKDFATRAYMETQLHEENCFVTLTYRPKDLPTYSEVDPHIYIKTGNLIKKDMQLFFKRLIKKYPNKGIRRLYCGELGPKKKRPHFHCLIYGYMPHDLVYWKNDEKGNPLFKSAELQKIWGKGFITVGYVTAESAGYCARYTMKKAGVKPQPRERKPNPNYNPLRKDSRINKYLYPKPIKNPEFVCSSRRPGIGRRYWEINKAKMIKDGGVWVFNQKLKHCVLNSIPKNFLNEWKNYYTNCSKTDYWQFLTSTKKRIWKETEDYYDFLHQQQKEFESYQQEILKKTGDTWEEYRRQQIQALHERIRALKREEEFDLNYET